MHANIDADAETSRESQAEPPTLVLGIGNHIKRDDVVGLEVVDALEQRFEDDEVAFETMTSGRIMLIDELAGHDRVFIVDSIKTDSGTPGDWYVLDPEELEGDSGFLATHNVGFRTLRQLGESIGERMPQVVVYAIEVEDPFAFQEGMTDVVATALPDLVDDIEAELRAELG
jgi:hydrogenase maturation protease